MKYCIDTSALIDAWSRWYPQPSFPALWQKVENLVIAGRIASTIRVFQEIQRKESGLHAWLNTRKGMFLPLTKDVQEKTKIILAQFPKLIDERPGKYFADPFVIATAQSIDAVVITSEKPTGTERRPKIPDVCDHFGVPCRDFVGLIVEEGWVF